MQSDIPRDNSREQATHRAEQGETGLIRLGCAYCDRQDFDGILKIPLDWVDVRELQSLADALRPVARDELATRSTLDWQTHLGVCPLCRPQHEATSEAKNDA